MSDSIDDKDTGIPEGNPFPSDVQAKELYELAPGEKLAMEFNSAVMDKSPELAQRIGKRVSEMVDRGSEVKFIRAVDPRNAHEVPGRIAVIEKVKVEE